MSETQPDLREALARELARCGGWEDPGALWTDNVGQISRGAQGYPVWQEYADEAAALIRGPLAPILAQVSALQAEVEAARALNRDLHRRTQKAESFRARHGNTYGVKARWAGRQALRKALAEVERLQRVEGEREKGRVPDGTGLSPKGEADKSSSSQSDFDPSREAESICHEEQLNIWSGEIVDCLSMGDYLRDDLSYDETLMIHAEAGDQIRSIIESAFDLLRKSRR